MDRKAINEEKSVSLEEIDDIQVTVSITPVHIIRKESSKDIKFHLNGKSFQEVKLVCNIDNRIAVVGLKRKYKCALPLEDLHLDVYIPVDYRKDLSIKTSSTAVKVDSLDFRNFTLHTSSGGLKAEGLKAENISITSSSGTIDIGKIDAKSLVMKGSTSSITIDECISDEVRIVASSGNVTLNRFDGDLDVKVSSGTVRIAYKDFENRHVHVETRSGNMTLELPQSAEFALDAKTSTGKILCDFPIVMAGNSGRTKMQGKVGTKQNQVSIRVTTGNISILKRI